MMNPEPHAPSYWNATAGPERLAGKDVPRDTPLTSAGLVPFPFPALRQAYLAGAYVAYGVKDRWF